MKGCEGCASSLLSLIRESIEYQKVWEFRKQELSPQVIDSIDLGFLSVMHQHSGVSKTDDTLNSRG
jgi:hypothetical protein